MANDDRNFELGILQARYAFAALIRELGGDVALIREAANETGAHALRAIHAGSIALCNRLDEAFTLADEVVKAPQQQNSFDAGLAASYLCLAEFITDLQTGLRRICACLSADDGGPVQNPGRILASAAAVVERFDAENQRINAMIKEAEAAESLGARLKRWLGVRSTGHAGG